MTGWRCGRNDVSGFEPGKPIGTHVTVDIVKQTARRTFLSVNKWSMFPGYAPGWQRSVSPDCHASVSRAFEWFSSSFPPSRCLTVARTIHAFALGRDLLFRAFSNPSQVAAICGAVPNRTGIQVLFDTRALAVVLSHRRPNYQIELIGHPRTPPRVTMPRTVTEPA